MTATTPSGNGFKLWVAAVVLVLLAGVAAVVIARGGNDDSDPPGQTGSVEVDTTGTSTPSVSGTSTPAEPGSTGTALPAYDGDADPDPAIGMTIPTVTGTGFDGQEITIAPDGKAKILLFVAHWCPHCQREVPLLVSHLDDQPLPDDVELITVSTGVQPGGANYPPEEWLDREGWSAPVIADDESSTIASTFGLTSFPYFVAVDADGKVVARASGELSTEQFDAVVAQAQGE